MQFNFWWFTSNIGTNILIATAVWFILSIVCQRSCSKGREMHPIGYIGYAIASFGMAFTSVAGIYAFSFAAPFVFIGMIIVMIAGRKSESVPRTTSQVEIPSAQRLQKIVSVTDGIETTCPSCGKEVTIRGMAIKPDGSAICPYCFARFNPDKSTL